MDVKENSGANSKNNSAVLVSFIRQVRYTCVVYVVRFFYEPSHTTHPISPEKIALA